MGFSKKEIDEALAAIREWSGQNVNLEYEDQDFISVAAEEEASNGEREWMVFKSMEDAERVAVERNIEDLREYPEGFTMEWLEDFMFISDTDRRIITGEEVDSQMDGFEDDDFILIDDDCKSIAEEIEDLEYELSEVEDELSAMLQEHEDWDDLDEKRADLEDQIDEKRADLEAAVAKARSAKEEELYDDTYKALENPIDYFVRDRGMYSREDLLKADFITFDYERAAQDAVDTEGIGHFLDNYDGEEEEVQGFILFGTN